MSRGAQEMAAKLRRLVKPGDITLDGKVTAVDESRFTCTVQLANGLDIDTVHLKALKGATKGFIVVPKVGSKVQIVNIGDPDYLAIAFEEVDKVVIKAAVKVEIACDAVEINGGNNHGMVISEKAAERLKTIESDINTLKQAISGWTPVPNDGGAALKAAAASWAGQQLQQTQRADIENTKVKH